MKLRGLHFGIIGARFFIKFVRSLPFGKTGLPMFLLIPPLAIFKSEYLELSRLESLAVDGKSESEKNSAGCNEPFETSFLSVG